jgi:hypothetical protein
MDYSGLLALKTHLRALYLLIDIPVRIASIPGNVEEKIAVSYTRDVARYLELPTWPKAMIIVSEHITGNELVKLAEKVTWKKLEVRYDSVEKLKSHDIELLPGNEDICGNFPGERGQLQELIGNLSACMALGAYDLSAVEGSLDLVKEFQGTGR